MADKPSTRDYTIKDLVVRSDDDHYNPDDSYEFSNGRKFESTDGDSGSGIYE